MITETRLIAFSNEALTEAIKLYAAAFKEKLPFGTLKRVWLKTVSPPLVAAEVESAGQTTVTEVEFSQAETAALLIHYCHRQKIPLPRNSEKSLTVDGDKLCLVITKKLSPAPA